MAPAERSGAGQACVLQDWLEGPVQAAPPYCGAGLVQVRVWVPPPQVREHELHPLQPPSMGAFVTSMEPLPVPVLPALLVQVNVHVALPGAHERGPELYEVAPSGWSVQLPEYVPKRLQMQLRASDEEVMVTVNGFGLTTEEGVTFTVTVGAEQLLFGGADAEQEPLHWIVPELVCPQALDGVQTLPYPEGLAGAEAEQEPLHWIVPELVCPQELAEELQAAP